MINFSFYFISPIKYIFLIIIIYFILFSKTWQIKCIYFFVLLSRFKEALNYLEIVQNFLDKGIHFKIYSWPGMTTVIQETKPDILKVSHLI